MKCARAVFIISFFFSVHCDRTVRYYREEDPEIYLSTAELIVKRGYPAETYTLKTEDGYILSLFRIPGNGTPVLLLPGILCTASDFIISGPDSHGLRLWRDGFDVWLGNFRGMPFSRGHIRLTTEQKEYWDFSWDEQAIYDIPAFIDCILEKVEKAKTTVFTHSFGGTLFYATMAARPEYNKKISLMIGMGSAAYQGDAKAPVRLLSPFSRLFGIWGKYIGNGEVGILGLMPHLQQHIFQWLCFKNKVHNQMCYANIRFINNYDMNKMNQTKVPAFLNTAPSVESMKLIEQFLQHIHNGDFKKFDYGIFGNLKHYRSTKPPSYDLSLVTCPIAVFWADRDTFATPLDIARLEESLPNVVASKPFFGYTHVDMLLGTKPQLTRVYDKVYKLLTKYGEDSHTMETMIIN